MKLSKQKAMEGVGKAKLPQTAKVVKDPRFSRLHSDPRFKRAFKHKLKVPIDSRFSHIFSDKRFADPLALDKRGRKPRKHSHKSSKKGHALHQYYRLQDGGDADIASPEDNGSDGAHEELESSFTKVMENGEKPPFEGHQNALRNGKSAPPSKKAKKDPLLSEATEGKARKTSTQAQLLARSEKKPGAFNSEDRHVSDLSDSDDGSVHEEHDDDTSEESFETSSASSSSSEYSSDEEDMADSPSEEIHDEKIATTETETRRLALVNMDWDHIRAIDILAVMNSFLPKGGQIVSVSVFPSEFGLQGMKEDEQRGPQGLFHSEDGDEDDEDAEDGVNMERLRQYEKDKLRYYYAVVECESVSTADFLYKACDGMEFERTSNLLDLRFIPDDMNFLNKPRDVATQIPADYQAPLFETRALQHSKVKLTWDDDEPDRVKSLRQKFNAEQLNDMDFKAYLASDASDSDIGENSEEDLENDDHEDTAVPSDPHTMTSNGKKGLRDKYRALLLEPDDGSENKDMANNDQDLEITFHSGLEELSKRLMDNKNKQKGSDETVWEAYLRKKKEKKKLQRQSKHPEEDDGGSVDEQHAGDGDNEVQGDAGFDDPFFKSSGELDFAVAEGTESESELVVAPVAKPKTSARAEKKAELKQKKLEEERSKAELELLFADELAAGNGVKGYNLKKKLRGKRRDAGTIPEKLPTVNYDDPRFSALFTSHRFAVDPTEPEFKRSAGQLRSLLEKQRKHLPQVREVVNSKEAAPEVDKAEDLKVATSRKAKQELSSMVRSLQRKVGGRGDM